MGGRSLTPVSADHRRQAGIAAGDDLDVTVELDTAEGPGMREDGRYAPAHCPWARASGPNEFCWLQESDECG
jgi:hypothetical protein